MTRIICITCNRDWNELCLQIHSYIKWLPKTYRLVYVIEDPDPTEWLSKWRKILSPILHGFQVEIIIGHELIKEWTLPFERGNEGWIRSALLKLLVTARENETCWVTDTKDFLIGPVEDKLGNIKSRDETGHFPLYYAVTRYSEKFNLKIPNKFPPCETPFEIYPHVVKKGLSIWSPVEWINWWRQFDYHSEFWLYHMWCVDQGVSHDIREYRTRKVWPNSPITHALMEIKKHNVSWTGLHREAPPQWNDEEKKLWENFLKDHELFFLDK